MTRPDLRERIGAAIAHTELIGYEPGCHEYLDIADAALSCLTLADHIAAVEAAGMAVVPGDSYNALAAARKYVWDAKNRDAGELAARRSRDSAPGEKSDG